MADEMKLILRELEKVNLRMDDLRIEMNGKINDLQDSNTRIQCEMSEMNSKISGLQDSNIEIKSEMDKMNSKINDLKNSNTRIQLLIENDLSKKIDIIGEGHDFLKMKLDEALLMEKKWESMGLEQINLRIDVNKLKDYVGIA